MPMSPVGKLDESSAWGCESATQRVWPRRAVIHCGHATCQAANAAAAQMARWAGYDRIGVPSRRHRIGKSGRQRWVSGLNGRDALRPTNMALWHQRAVKRRPFSIRGCNHAVAVAGKYIPSLRRIEEVEPFVSDHP